MHKPLPTLKLGMYRHFKGMIVEVLMVGRHSETQEPMVVYRELGEFEEWGMNPIWVRPLKMFTETIERDGERVKRFELLGVTKLS